jgi:hypothetical protein
MEHIEQIGFTGDYMSITQASFDQFRIIQDNKASRHPQQPISTSTPQNSSTSPSYDTPPDQNFRHKNKADPTLFPVLKDAKYH